jgi:predicted DNA-binding transcriptional regulator AlpA
MSTADIVKLSPYWTEIQAAAYLGLSKLTLHRARIAGTGPSFYKIGRKIVYTQATLDAWVTRDSFASTAEAKAKRAA